MYTIPRVVLFFVLAVVLGHLVEVLSASGWLVGILIVLILSFGWQALKLIPSRQYDEYALYDPYEDHDEHSRDFNYT